MGDRKGAAVNAECVIRCIALVVLLAGFRPALGQISTDHVMRSGFEAVPSEVFPRIEFVGDRSLVFSSTGQTRGMQVRVLDAAGELVADPDVVWQSALPGNVSVGANGVGNATVQSVAAWTGSIRITASYPPLGVQVQGEATFATLVPGTVVIDSAWVRAILGNRGEAHRIVLERNSATDALQADDIIVSGDYAGIVARVVSLDIGATTINAEVVPALLTDAYEDVEFGGEGEPLSVALKLVGDSAALIVRSKRTGVVLQRETLTKADVLGLLSCEGGLSLTGGLELSGLSVEWSLVPRAGLRIASGEVVDFLVLVEGSVGIDASASLKAIGTTSLEGECTASFPSIALAAIPAGPLYLSPSVAPEVKVSASASASFAMDFVPVSLERGWSFRAGVRYTATNGWSTIAEAGEDNVTANSVPFNFESGFAMEVRAGVGLEGLMAFYLGYPAVPFKLLDVKLIEVEGGPFKEWALDTPVSPSQAAYTGPQVESGVEASAHLSFEAELFKGTLSKYLPLTLETDLNLTFMSGRAVYDRLPSVTADVQCSPLCAAVAPGTGALTLRMLANTTDTGTAEFWIGPKGSPSLSLLGSTLFSQEVGHLELAVPTTFDLGEYDIFARLRLDGPANEFTQFVPLAAPGAIGGFSVVDTQTVNVRRLDNASGQPTQGGLVESSGSTIMPAINCGVQCEGAAIAGTTAVLTAHDAVGGTFVRWAESGACAGSTDRQCSFVVDGDKTAMAEFSINNEFSFEVAEAERPWDPAEYPRLTCNHFEGEYQISGYYASFDRCYSGMSAVIRCVGAGCSSERFKVAIRKSILSGTVVGRGEDCNSRQDPYGIDPGSTQVYAPSSSAWFELGQAWTKAWSSVTNISPLPNYSFIFQNFHWIGADPGLPCSADTTATLELEFNVYDVATGSYTVIPFLMTVP